MVCEGCKPDEDLFVFEGRDAIADDFGGFAGEGGADGDADFLECGALRLGNSGEVFFDGGRRLGRFGAFHARDGTRKRVRESRYSA